MILRLLSFIIVTIVAPVAVSMAFFPLATARIDIAAGKAAFAQSCASCHSTEPSKAGFGPSLNRIGKLAASRVAALSAEEYLAQSILQPNAFKTPGTTGEMPLNVASRLSQEQLRNIIAYLMSEGGEVRHRRILALSLNQAETQMDQRIEWDLGSIERGKALFFGKKFQCVNCHSLDPFPGFRLPAPSLLTAGQHSRRYLDESIRQPSAVIAKGYEKTTIVTDGRIFSGRRLKSSHGSVRLLVVSNGKWQIQSFKEDDLDDDPLLSMSSPMPDYSKSMSDQEREDIINFLVTLH